jgi:hypothetical protein
MASNSTQHQDGHLQTVPSGAPLAPEPATFPPESPTSPRRSGSIPPSPTAAQLDRARTRTNTSTSISSIPGMIRRASIGLMNSDPPPGFLAASAQTIASAPSMSEIRRGSFSHDGWNQEKQLEHDRRRKSSATSAGGRGPLSRSSSGFSMGNGNRQDAQPINAVAEESEHVPSAPVAGGREAVTAGDKTSTEASIKPQFENPQAGYEDLVK